MCLKDVEDGLDNTWKRRGVWPEYRDRTPQSTISTTSVMRQELLEAALTPATAVARDASANSMDCAGPKEQRTPASRRRRPRNAARPRPAPTCDRRPTRSNIGGQPACRRPRAGCARLGLRCNSTQSIPIRWRGASVGFWRNERGRRHRRPRSRPLTRQTSCAATYSQRREGSRRRWSTIVSWQHRSTTLTSARQVSATAPAAAW